MLLGRLFWRACAALAICFALARLGDAQESPAVGFANHDDCVEITIGGKPFATYVYHDPKIPRPYFAHVHAPDGTQVTRHHPPVAGQDKMDHPEFHPGIWMAFGDVGGNDYWRLKAMVRSTGVKSSLLDSGEGGILTGRNEYLDANDESKVVCAEVFSDTIRRIPAGYLLTLDSTFGSEEEFYFGDQEEMGLGVRVATPMRVEEGDGSLPLGTGTITDAKGRTNGAEIGGNSAAWCNYRGTVDGKHVGITIFCHPENFRPSWFHARDYGFLAANPFGRAAFRKGEPSKVVVKPGESFRLRYGVLVYADDDDSPPDLDAAYKLYVQLTQDQAED